MMSENKCVQVSSITKLKAARIVRKCPYCGRMLYEKLGKCEGVIQIKCQKCGKFVNMNLALRRTRR